MREGKNTAQTPEKSTGLFQNTKKSMKFQDFEGK